MAARNLPDTGEFFISCANLIENAGRQLSSAIVSGGLLTMVQLLKKPEFLLRHQNEFERTLSSLHPRVGEIYRSLPALQKVVTDLTYFSNHVSFLRSHS